MRYRLLLRTLRLLIYIKRFFWFLGRYFLFVFGWILRPLWRLLGYLFYKLGWLYKKIASAGSLDSQLLKRDYLQLIVFALLFIAALPHTKFLASAGSLLPGQKTIAYAIFGQNQEFAVEEIIAQEEFYETPAWREGLLSAGSNLGAGVWQKQDLAGAVAGGTAISKPMLIPGAAIGGTRDKTIEYIVEPGDSLGSIAVQFDVDVATILWENNLSVRNYIRPGDVLRILPVSGLTHIIKRGDNLKKITLAYEAKTEDIVKFNKLKSDGTDLIIGEKIIIPGGVKAAARAIASAPRTSQVFRRVAVPPRSLGAPSLLGFLWPTAARTITQYFSWRHSALDIAGPMSTAIYASKSGAVEKSQCGWNSGYGCVIIISHGGGVKTLYGHNSRLLVSAGDSVERGQTIALMGNTGRVYGRTGIHTHFEININGRRVNPLGYVR
ncbi:M23 family metallopeptidase [Patescibacteria group bacterium]|nr:MAG: M23 family metallopeptidase [Patescibacteria group bacterium]